MDIQKVTKEYYDSEDAFNFNHDVWGGESIHVGLYDELKLAEPGDVKAKADWCRETARLATSALFTKTGQNLDATCKVADFGSGYGGTMIYASKTFGCKTLCVDMSTKHTAVCRQRIADANLVHLVSCPSELSVFDTGAEAASFDLVVSQEALLHCGSERHRAVAEAARMLKPGGFFCFTDIMQADDADVEVLRATGVLERIKLETIGSTNLYTEHAMQHGMRLVSWEDRGACMATHYAVIRDILAGRRESFRGKMSEAYIEGMLTGLVAWVDAANKGLLCWGYLVFQKT